MSKNKYFWLRLKRDFFKRHDIRIIESMPNGKDYILFYLKLLCESVDHDGCLRFSDSVPYNADMLATITCTNVDIVRSAVKIFTELEMMDVLDDGTFYMCEVEKMIGSCAQDEHTRESTRLRVQAHRERKKQALLPENLSDEKTQKTKNRYSNGYSNATCNGEKEIEIEIEFKNTISKDMVLSKPPIPYQQIVDDYNSKCVNLPKVVILSDKRKTAIKRIFNNKDIGQAGLSMAFSRVADSDFLNGKNKQGWKASFDWILNPTNIAKILEGNYDNKKSFETVTRWAEG